MKTVFITGGSGFIGSFLCPALKENDWHIILSSRRKPTNVAFDRIVDWMKISDSERMDIIDSSDAVVNLAGAGIADKRWSDEYKQVLHSSRIEITRSIADTIERADNPPEVFISGSAVGFYSDRDEQLLDESSHKGDGFLADLSDDWEKASSESKEFTRLVNARIGVVLHPDGGALKKMLPPFKSFVGGPIGSGKQFMPWIHIRDLVEAFIFIMNNPSLKGFVNLTSPNPATMNEFALALGKVLKRPSMMRVPSSVLKAMLGESADMVLASQRVVPNALIRSGFEFDFPILQDALFDLLKRRIG